MASSEVPLNLQAENLISRVHLKVTIHESSKYKLRIWIAKQLVHLAGWIMQVGRTDITVEDD